MRIDSYTLGMDSARLYKSPTVSRTTYGARAMSAQGSDDALMSFNDYLAGKEETSKEAPEAEKVPVKDDTSYSPYSSFNFLRTRATDRLERSDRSVQSEFQKLHQYMIRHIFDLLFGDKENTFNEAKEGTVEAFGPGVGGVTRIVAVTEEYTDSFYYAEEESTSFHADGEIHTADGRTIDLNLNISMSRSFYSYYEQNYSVSTLQIVDPIVINFDGNLAGLNSGDEMSFLFDLDCDGEEEKLASLKSGSGFLALDRNGDGIINDGSELFGPKSGNGFGELAALDEDGNGWIDEGDSVFELLKVWVKSPDGEDVLYALKDLDIGALYTGAADTEFSLTDATNAAMGYVRQTGLFLYENGTAGTLQHVDLVS